LASLIQRIKGTPSPDKDFWQAYLEWREYWQVEDMEDEDDLFADLRDTSPRRSIDLWD
jgi:hypothetical protein